MSGLADLLPVRAKKVADAFRVLTEDKRALILYYLREGTSRPEACGLARVSYKTFSKAMTEGEIELVDIEEFGLEMTVKAQFASDVQYAEAKAIRDYGKRLRTYGDPKQGGDPRNWAAEFTHRERTQPSTYGRKSTVSVQQEQAVRVIFEERGGNQWQGVREAEPQRQIESGDIVDTDLTDGE